MSLSAASDLEELRRVVHQLKGAGGGYGFPKITEIAARAEANIKAQADCQTIQAGVNELIELDPRRPELRHQQRKWFQCIGKSC